MGLFLALGLFSLVSLVDFGAVGEVRAAFLSAGTGGLYAYALALTVRQLRYDPLVLAFVWALLAYWTFAFPPAIGLDDNSGYLIFAADFLHDLDRTLQPLSERRLFSLGSSYALQAPILHWLGPELLTLVEPVLGLLLLFLLVCERLKGNILAPLLLGVIALFPFTWGKWLINTSSAYVLAGFSLAILETIRAALRSERPTAVHITLLFLLPLGAAAFRPTTLPFNAGVAGLALLSLAVQRRLALRTLVVAAPCFALFFAAALPYQRTFGTFLYPVLGRGLHITSVAPSISNTLSLTEHASNLWRVALADFLFAPTILLAWVAWKRASEPAVRRTLLWLLPLYVGFFALMVFATGGTEPYRYIAPVSIAVFLTLAVEVLEPAHEWAQRRLGPYGLALRAAFCLCFLGGLLVVRAKFGDGVVRYRAALNTLPPGQLAQVRRAAGLANATGGSAMLIAGSANRHLAASLSIPYWVVDQPGMVLPRSSQAPAASYQDRFVEFLRSNDVRTVILEGKVDCEPRSAAFEYKGWDELMVASRLQNRRAVCAIAPSYRLEQMPNFTLLVLPVRGGR